MTIVKVEDCIVPCSWIDKNRRHRDWLKAEALRRSENN